MTNLDYLPWRRPAAYDDRPAIRDAHHDLTYAQFGAWTDAVAEQFAGYGVGPGSVVAVMLPNRVELLVVLVAAWRLGAAATPINPMFTTHEADYQINDADAAVVVNAGPDAPTGGRPSISVDDLRRTRRGDRTLSAPVTESGDLALLIYTSGSTGRPKGVMLSHSNIDAMAAMMAERLKITEQDHCLLVLPLFHVNAICISFLHPDRGRRQRHHAAAVPPVEFLAAIAKYRPTYFSAVPTIYSHLVSQPFDVHRRHVLDPVRDLRRGARLDGTARRDRGALRDRTRRGLRPDRGHLRVDGQPRRRQAQGGNRRCGTARTAGGDHGAGRSLWCRRGTAARS